MRSWLNKTFSALTSRRAGATIKNGIISADNNRAIKAFVEDQIKSPSFNASLSEDDEMYLFARRIYKGNKDRACIETLTTGKQSFNVVRAIVEWKFGDLSKITSFLDFASGYGRLTRFLVQEVSPDRIWVCDIYSGAVRFQTEQFGVHGIVSTTRPEDYHDTMKYDCVFVGSLFSHLSEDMFIGWLRRLYELLTPSGVLAFSVHDMSLLPSHMEPGDRGIVFVAESESRTLDKNIYGTTYVSESFVRNAIIKVTGRPDYKRGKRGLWSFQDMYVVARNDDAEYGSLDISQGLTGYVDCCRLTAGGDVHVAGWAADFREDSYLREVQVVVNGKFACSYSSFIDRHDVAEVFQDNKCLRSGFSFDIARHLLKPGDCVLIKIINTEGAEHVLRAGDFESILDD